MGQSYISDTKKVLGGFLAAGLYAHNFKIED
jgi:hypothetical protein